MRSFRYAGAIIAGALISHTCAPTACEAYIGPGAGFAFLSSFLFILGGFILAFLALLSFPFRWALKKARTRRGEKQAKARRLIILGFDGFDAELARAFMNEGKLPNLSRLRAEGHFSPLRTTTPPISPVAWSTFMTGVNPGKHNVFDFLRREEGSYLPALSSARISGPSRSLRIGRYRIPLGKPAIAMLRKSVPFWKSLGEHGIPAVVLKVPISFPPERFPGLLLSGLCAPDLKGSQGTFACYASGEGGEERYTGGYLVRLAGGGPVFDAHVSGPRNPFRDDEELRIPLRIAVDGKKASLRAGDAALELREGELSDWVPLVFRAPAGVKIRGIAQFFLKSASPTLRLYLSPIHIDPEKPSLPLSHPFTYSIYLAKLFGAYATLGLPQDTWALNENVLTDEAFLEQTYRIHAKLEEIFFHSLRRMRKGMLCCVFDTSDVIQHEFWRYLDMARPALKGDAAPKPAVIEELYRRMDGLAGRVLEQLRPGDVVFVCSDHGFKLFHRGVNLNTWLLRGGYLALKGGSAECGEYFEGVDWERTRAYALGLSGIYLNLKGREPRGIVEPHEAAALKEEIAGKLAALADAEKGEPALAAVYDTAQAYRGPYTGNAPDLIAGYRPGYRTSWESVIGRVMPEVFSENAKAWSADHCIDPRFVPGVLFCNRRLAAAEPGLEDIAPTVLDLFGIAPPAYMDGKPMGIATG